MGWDEMGLPSTPKGKGNRRGGLAEEYNRGKLTCFRRLEPEDSGKFVQYWYTRRDGEDETTATSSACSKGTSEGRCKTNVGGREGA
jgi:hypothetical protein